MDGVISELFVKNLDFDVTERELADEIAHVLRNAQPTDYAGECRCSIVKIPRDYESGGSRGFAFVTVDTGLLDADQAATALFGHELQGRGMHVEKLRPRKEDR